MRKLIGFVFFVSIILVVYFGFIRNNDDIRKIEYELASTEINEILSDPRKYENKTVTVSGRVANSFSLGIKFYSINDGTGTIYVRTEKAVPLEGELVKVNGRFNQFLKIGSKQYSTITEIE